MFRVVEATQDLFVVKAQQMPNFLLWKESRPRLSRHSQREKLYSNNNTII